MSEQSIRAIQDAIAKHVTEENPGLLIDWIIGYSTINDDNGFRHSYITAPASTPAGSYGLASLTVDNIATDLLGNDDKDDD